VGFPSAFGASAGFHSAIGGSAGFS